MTAPDRRRKVYVVTGEWIDFDTEGGWEVVGVFGSAQRARHAAARWVRTTMTDIGTEGGRIRFNNYRADPQRPRWRFGAYTVDHGSQMIRADIDHRVVL